MASVSWRPAVGRRPLLAPVSRFPVPSAVSIAGSAKTCWDVACENPFRTFGLFVVLAVVGCAACRPSCPHATLDGAD